MKKIVILTVDVETPQTPLLEGKVNECLIDKEFDGEKWGVSKILSLMEDFGFKGTFFVNILESYRFGEKHIRETIDLIETRGHEAALHTHPVWINRSEHRENLWEFSRDELVRIVETEVSLFEKITGKYPISHRAGIYSINHSVLNVLEQFEIKFDSSSFWHHPNCKFSPSINKPVKVGKLIEIPITVFVKQITVFDMPLLKKIVKFDLDWAPLKDLFEILKNSVIDIYTFSLHSYSLMKFDRNWRKIAPDFCKLRKLQFFLSFLKSNEDKFQVMPMRNLLRQDWESLLAHSPDILPSVKLEMLSNHILPNVWIYSNHKEKRRSG